MAEPHQDNDSTAAEQSPSCWIFPPEVLYRAHHIKENGRSVDLQLKKAEKRIESAFMVGKRSHKIFRPRETPSSLTLLGIKAHRIIKGTC